MAAARKAKEGNLLMRVGAAKGGNLLLPRCHVELLAKAVSKASL
jgi:hypothetical protein